MSKEQKEGVLIATVSMIALLILALLTSWKSGFSDATFYFNGFETSCTPTRISPPSTPDKYELYVATCPDGKEYVWGFYLEFKTILIFFLPIISYGVLRAFGIVRRLFQFEEKLFKFIEE